MGKKEISHELLKTQETLYFLREENLQLHRKIANLEAQIETLKSNDTNRQEATVA